MIEELKKVIIENIGNDEMELTPETSLKDDLELDSFELAQLVCSVEDFFNIEIPDSSVSQISTVEDLIKCIESY